jgi:ElaB/YqjD/DUF883 family membrane-anchored ribosome-binding protein
MDEKSDVITYRDDPELEQLGDDMNRTESDMEETTQSMREDFSMERTKKRTQDAFEGLQRRTSALIQERGDDVRRAADRVGQTVKDNPIPFAIVGGAGVGALAYSFFQRRSREQDRIRAEERIAEVYTTETYPQGGVHQYYGASPAEEGSGPRETLRERAGSMTHAMGDRARRMKEQARYGSERLGTDLVDTIKAHPFVAGTAVFCMGLLSGLLIPAIRQEKEWMEPAVEAVKEKAQKKKEEFVESAKRVAEQATEAAQEEAGRQGSPTEP